MCLNTRIPWRCLFSLLWIHARVAWWLRWFGILSLNYLGSDPALDSFKGSKVLECFLIPDNFNLYTFGLSIFNPFFLYQRLLESFLNLEAAVSWQRSVGPGCCQSTRSTFIDQVRVLVRAVCQGGRWKGQNQPITRQMTIIYGFSRTCVIFPMESAGGIVRWVWELKRVNTYM